MRGKRCTYPGVDFGLEICASARFALGEIKFYDRGTQFIFVSRRFRKKEILMRAFSTALLLLCLLLLSRSAMLGAQELATLTVTVADQTGATIPRAQLTLKNVSTGATRKVATDAGLAVIAALPAGTYELETDAAEFSPSFSKFSLAVGQNGSLLVNLAINAIKEELEVR